jgi:hypothetical protein
MGQKMRNLLQLAVGASVVYAAYKIGQSNGEKKELPLIKSIKDEVNREIDAVSNEIKKLREEKTVVQIENDEIVELKRQLEELKTQLGVLKDKK